MAILIHSTYLHLSGLSFALLALMPRNKKKPNAAINAIVRIIASPKAPFEDFITIPKKVPMPMHAKPNRAKMLARLI